MFSEAPIGDKNMFCKNMCSEKFCKFHKKAPVVDSLFNKVGRSQASFTSI